MFYDNKRRRHNAGAMSLTQHPVKAALAGFNLGELKSAGVAIGGAFGTSWLAGKVASMIGVQNKLLSTGLTLLTAGGLAVGARKLNLSKKTADDILLGGMIAGVTEGLSGIFPQYIKPIGMHGAENELGINWNLEGMNDEATVSQIRHTIGTGSWATPSPGHQETTAMHGLGWHPGQLYRGTSDYAGPRTPEFTLQGVRPGFNAYADAMVSEHIASE